MVKLRFQLLKKLINISGMFFEGKAVSHERLSVKSCLDKGKNCTTILKNIIIFFLPYMFVIIVLYFPEFRDVTDWHIIISK